jgi:hypothetical protein
VAVATPEAQLAVEHDAVLLGSGPQAARSMPSQVAAQSPVPPQAARVPAGCWPSGRTVQLPTEPIAAHSSQEPVQAWLQQTPSAQKPLTQSDAVDALHAPPSGILQALPAPAAQVAGAVQLETAQQTLLVQKSPLEQSEAIEQAAPAPPVETQLPPEHV